ncbi:MAG: SixA phosphatase family protein [Planctomycetota bacterium]
MELVLVRHAKAFERDPAAWPDDARRPLTAEGRRAFARFAKGLGRLVGRVDRLESSRFVRAWETALLLHEHAGFPKPAPLAQLEPLEPLAEGDTLAALSRRLDAAESAEVVVWVGHEPDLSRLASQLLAGDPGRLAIAFRKGDALALRVTTAEGAAPRAELLWMTGPAQARRLRKRRSR